MCWKCDNPHATLADYLELVRGAIDRRGWIVQLVARDRLRPGFGYTVGLTGLGMPELLVTGLPDRRASAFLDGAADHQVHHDADPLTPGDRVEYRGFPETEIVQVAEPTVHLVTAAEIYGPTVEAVQVVYADDRGRWPWEVGFRGKQAVLGPRATRSRPGQ